MEKHWQENLCGSAWRASTSPATEVLKIVGESNLSSLSSHRNSLHPPTLDIGGIHTHRTALFEETATAKERGARFHFIFCHIVPVTEEEEREGSGETKGQLDTSNLIEYWINMANTVTNENRKKSENRNRDRKTFAWVIDAFDLNVRTRRNVERELRSERSELPKVRSVMQPNILVKTGIEQRHCGCCFSWKSRYPKALQTRSDAGAGRVHVPRALE
ncbi:hypothetical protein K0M31_013072 [Melipona bicolor]|uniref:Uncharacterized protein n=1 Tax=Melipona bicolor TaxID=60889 RepID=A0AA40FIS0_9HYME|nr:hypothetical protein K0M31_013072 [Melipona bicolor]